MTTSPRGGVLENDSFKKSKLWVDPEALRALFRSSMENDSNHTIILELSLYLFDKQEFTSYADDLLLLDLNHILFKNESVWFSRCARFQHACFKFFNIPPHHGAASQDLAFSFPISPEFFSYVLEFSSPESESVRLETLKRFLCKSRDDDTNLIILRPQPLEDSLLPSSFFYDLPSLSLEALTRRWQFLILKELVNPPRLYAKFSGGFPCLKRIGMSSSHSSFRLLLVAEEDNVTEKGEYSSLLSNRRDALWVTRFSNLKKPWPHTLPTWLQNALLHGKATPTETVKSSLKEAIETCFISKLSYVESTDGNDSLELVKQIFERSPTSRVLVYSSKHSQLLRIALTASTFAARAIVLHDDAGVVDKQDHAFSLQTWTRRMQDQVALVLSQVQTMFPFPVPSCSFASTLELPHEIQGQVKALMAWEVFSQHHTPSSTATLEYFYHVHCNLLLASPFASFSRDLLKVDFLIMDHVSSQLDLALISKFVDAQRVVCFSPDGPGFAVRKWCSLVVKETGPTTRLPPGFAHPYQVVSAVSLKDEAEFLVSTLQYALKVGYDVDDVLVLACTEKQCHVLDETMARAFRGEVCVPACELYAQGDENQKRTKKMMLIASGGIPFSNNKFKEPHDDAVVVFACHETWKPVCQEQGLGLVLGERLGEAFDPELREATLYDVHKASELKTIVANL